MRHEPTAWKAATANRFDEIAEDWRKRRIIDQERVKPFIENLNCPPGSLILDAGCGSGNWSAPLALQGYRVRGFDISPQMVAEAQVVLSEAGLSAEQANISLGDAEEIRFPDATFDAIMCINVLDFTPQPGKALQEFGRVLRPEGRLVLLTLGAYSPVKRQWWKRFLPEDDQLHTGNDILPWEMEALLEELGWQIVAQEPLFGPAMNGVSNNFDAEKVAQLTDRVLQQAIASAWKFVATKP